MRGISFGPMRPRSTPGPASRQAYRSALRAASPKITLATSGIGGTVILAPCPTETAISGLSGSRLRLRDACALLIARGQHDHAPLGLLALGLAAQPCRRDRVMDHLALERRH